MPKDWLISSAARSCCCALWYRLTPSSRQTWSSPARTSNHQQFADQAEQYLKGVAGKLAARGIKVRTIICEGPVAEAILDHAKESQIDLIVMSTHGRGGVSRWVYGSVADRVLQARPVRCCSCEWRADRQFRLQVQVASECTTSVVTCSTCRPAT